MVKVSNLPLHHFRTNFLGQDKLLAYEGVLFPVVVVGFFLQWWWWWVSWVLLMEVVVGCGFFFSRDVGGFCSPFWGLI